MGKANPLLHKLKRIEPDYNPYGTKFTDRQNEIIKGVDPSSIKLSELIVIMKKARINGFDEIAEQIYEMYEDKIVGKEKPKYSIEQAKNILQSMTPWEIKW